MVPARCAAADVEPQRFELHVVFLGAVKQVEDEWGGAHRPGYAFLVHDFDCFASAEFLLQNNAAAQKQRRDKAVVETGGVVQRCRHEHDVVLRKVQAAAKRCFRENECVVGDQNSFRTTGGAGSRKIKTTSSDLLPGFSR